MIRIDAHQHYWSLRRGDYGWLTPSAVGLYRDFMPDNLAPDLNECAMHATVLVQAAPTEGESRFLFDLARRHPSIAGVVGWTDFEANDVAQRISRLVRDGQGILKGLRPMVQDISDPDWLDRDSLDAAFEAMIANDLVFDALVTPRHLGALERRLRRHPKLRAVIDHAGKPDIADTQVEPWGGLLQRLAHSGEVHCKLSGLLTQARLGAGVAELGAFVSRIFSCFGADRIMWGSDWPVVTLRATYRDWLQMSLDFVRRHAPESEDAVFGANAVRFYHLDVKGKES